MTNIAITIGVQEYEFLTPLKYTANDANKMREFLLEEGDFDEVFYFSDDSPKFHGVSTRPTRSNLELLLEDEVKTLYLKTGDNLWFFFAGHGSRKNNIDYLIPIDGHSNVEVSGISVNYIIQQLQNSGADNIVLILDACRDKSDRLRGGEGVGKQTQQEAREKGIITIFSCSPNEHSWELEELEQGVFTYALLEGLGSKGRKATPEKLNEYLKYRVEKLAQKKGKQQTPRIIAAPIEKSHLILIPKYATKNDISILKNDAYRAQMNGDLKLAEQLWVRVLEVGLDIEAVKALQKIAIAVDRQTLQSFPSPQSYYLDDSVKELNFPQLPKIDISSDSSNEVIEKPTFYWADYDTSELSPIGYLLIEAIQKKHLPKPIAMEYAPKKGLPKCLVLDFNDYNVVVYCRDEEFKGGEQKWNTEDEINFKSRLINQQSMEGIQGLVFTVEEIMNNPLKISAQIKDVIDSKVLESYED
jgi:uncharacterized caspase-like protein